MRRFVTLVLSMSLLLGLTTAGRLLAQDEKKDQPKAEETKKDDAPKKDEAKKEEPKKDDAPKDAPKEAAKADTSTADAPLPPIPPEVQAKLEAARKAVAEAIVAAQDAGLVESSIDPPPVLDILITGRAVDARSLKKATKDNPEVGVSPEVFGAWFTGYGKPTEGVTAEKNIRIIPPTKGLNDWYRDRASFLTKYIDEARKAKGGETKKAEQPAKKEEAAKAEEKKDEAPKDAPKAA